MYFMRRAACALVATFALTSLARAHVVLEWPAAVAGSYYKATFRIGHGCGASATRQVTVDIPAGVQGARPMPHPGWGVTIERAALARPYTNHGRTVAEDVVRITWTAKSREDMLDAAHYDEFSLQARLPDQAGTLHWPVRQVCEQGRLDWVQVPAAGQKWSDLQAPAPQLDVLPAGGTGGHLH